MKISPAKVAPTALVLAFAGYSAWPYMESPGGPPTVRPDVAEIASALMQGGGGPGSPRDPFQLPGDLLESAKGRGRGAKSAPGPGARGDEARPNLLASLSRLVASGESYAAKARKENDEIRANLLAAYTLSATSSRGTRRVAILNGRAYSQGDVVEATTALPAPVFLMEVHADRVRLRCLSARVDIGFPSASTPAASPAGPVAASADEAPEPPARGERKGGGGRRPRAGRSR